MIRGALGGILLAVFAVPTTAQSLKQDEVFSSISLRTLAQPSPVLGADGRIHVAYELVAANPTPLFVTFGKVEALDDSGKIVSTLEGPGLAAMTVVTGGDGARLAPGGSAYIFMDAVFANGSALPAKLQARVTLTRQSANPAGDPVELANDMPFPATATFTGAPVAVEVRPAVAIMPPLRGGHWLAVNGCCNSVTSHRGAVMAIDGALRVPERFAIDWVQLDSNDRLYSGPIGALTSYAYFGAPVYAVADGVVVNRYDEAVEQVPGEPAKGINFINLGGNELVIDIGGGNYAFFAHLQPGSLRFKVGDRVKTGDVIGLLGNTGNSDAPHLHFHMMDGDSPINSNGIPYVFASFTGQGVMGNASIDDLFAKRAAAKIDRAALAGMHTNQLPLNNQVVDFGK